MIKNLNYDPDLAFEIVYNEFGGRWLYPDKEKDFHSHYLRYVSSIPRVLVDCSARVLSKIDEEKRGHTPDMYFGLLNSQHLNCFATIQGERYFVGIGAMVPIALLEAAANYFADQNYYPEIGDISKGPRISLDGIENIPFFQISSNRFTPLVPEGEDELIQNMLCKSVAIVRGSATHIDHRTGRLLSASKYLEQFDSLVDMLLPLCPIRRAHCTYQASVMAHFFWSHEIAHVTQGHLRYLSEQSCDRLLTLYEFPFSTRNRTYGERLYRIQNIDQLAMELDADLEALLITLGIINNDVDIESDEFPYVDREQRMELFIFMLIVVFQAMATQEVVAGTATTHPPARIRVCNMLRYMMGIGKEKRTLSNALSSAVRKVAELAQYGKYKYLAGLPEALTSFEKTWLEIDSHRMNLQLGYEKYAYHGLRGLIGGFLKDVEGCEGWHLGPEPIWWRNKIKNSI